MIGLDRALAILSETAVIKGSKRVPLNNALQHVIAEDIVAPEDIPAFNRSAMDGFACRYQDLPSPLEIIETIPAGVVPARVLDPGTCSRIMTGAMIPGGADCVIKVEDTRVSENKVFFTGELPKNNIRSRGEDAAKGTVLISAGTLIKPQHIAVMASAGCIDPLVYKQPSVAVISTGNELIEPAGTPAGALIRNSNGPQMLAQLMSLGIKGDYLGIVNDDKPSLLEKIKQASEYDLVLVSGGVSMGEYDFVPGILQDAGYSILISQVAVRPGKPLIFGAGNGSFCFGVPGNPVSSFVQFELLIKPFIMALQGNKYSPRISVNEAGAIHRLKKFDQLQFVPVAIENNRVMPVKYKGSGHISSYALADGLMEVEPGKTMIQEGEKVHVRLL